MGTEQKSFLGPLSPWGTPRSVTPQPTDAPKPEALQRSHGEDHTVSHRHRLSLHRYPLDCPPLKVRWFYAVDSPKRKLSLMEPKKADQKPLPPPKKFIPFSARDSQSVEGTFQKLSDIQEAHQHNKPKPKETVSSKVPVNEDFLFMVDVEQRELSPIYWIAPVYEVRRGTWFIQEGSNLKPCEENLATQLEEGYIKICPWRTDPAKSDPTDQLAKTTEDISDQTRPTLENRQGHSTPPSASATPSRGVGNGSSGPLMETQQYRLFGAYMNRIVAYQDSTTAWLMNDDFMSRFSTSVYQRLGGVPGTKLIRGFEPRKSKDSSEGKGPRQKPQDDDSPATGLKDTPKEDLKTPKTDLNKAAQTEVLKESERPRFTIERQMSSLAGEPQNPAELEEQARKQEEQEMEESREIEGEDREREVDHLILVTHGIGQRLGLRLESINFIHDVNVLRKTLKTVYKGSPDLQALNSALPDSGRNCRVQVLPVCWRHLLDFPHRGVRQNRKELDLTDADVLEDEAYPSLSDITLDSVPAVRNLISDLAMDVLLYQSGYCEHISNIVTQESNRILRLYREQNPSFKGSVSLVGHSLGSAILFDILCNQRGSTKHGSSPRGKSQESNDRTPSTTNGFDFECEELFCLGSPIALFQMLKGKTIGGHSVPDPRNRKDAIGVEICLDTPGHGHGSDDNPGIISTPKCRDLYNIFHPSDPVSYRLEPLISPAMANLKPQPLPSVKKSLWTTSGQSLSILGSRMGQSVGSMWTNFTTGVASSLLNRSLGLTSDDASASASSGTSQAGNDSTHRRTLSDSTQHSSGDDQQQTLIESDLETLYDGFQKNRRHQNRGGSPNRETETDQDRKLRFEDAKVRAMNANGRVDYSIQEGAFDISLIASVASHLTYWGDEDVNHFMLSQILSRRHRHRSKRK